MDKLLTIPEVAEILNMSKAKVYLLAKKKRIPHIRIDKNVRVKESELLRWLEKQTEPIK